PFLPRPNLSLEIAVIPVKELSWTAAPSNSSGHDSNRHALFKRRIRGELASRKSSGMFRFSARPVAMISIDTIWLAIEPMDMRADAGCRGVRCDEAALCLSVRRKRPANTR
ncbi:hypothetical protein, partial [Pseudomonas coronafaciens]|uniref:hypothetical protein n=1 Tax=Pseudomonas coronafaciens TaxID=53409 RepID=UPI001C80A025